MLSHFILMKLYYLRRAEGKTSDYVEGTSAGPSLQRNSSGESRNFQYGSVHARPSVYVTQDKNLHVICNQRKKKGSLTRVLVDNCIDSYCQRPIYDYLLFSFYHFILFFNTGSST